MKPSQTPQPESWYRNPVHSRSCPDPFVLKFGGEYWCYFTGLSPDGRAFGVLHSRDLVSWRELGGALTVAPEQGGATCWWAPEVTYENGRFLMYYSVGDGVRMEIRVAASEHPAGPFSDSGRRLTREEFAIDAHVFVDADGTRHLFYATDFLEHTHIGTGTVRDRLVDPFTLAGEAVPVTRARYDWQVYDPARQEKGGVRWHTVEGPFVLRRKGRYYQMFSGGNWQNVSYGVSYATSERVDAQGEWEQASDGERVLPILRTLPGEVRGPGHNSVVRAPDNQELFCVYHVWTPDASARVLAIDRLEWVGERMAVLGPTTGRVRAPHAPAFADFFDAERAEGLGEGWEYRGGRWVARGGEAVQEDAGVARAEAMCAAESSAFVLEVTMRGVAWGDEASAYGVSVADADGEPLLEFLIVPQMAQAMIIWQGEQGGHTERLALPEEFNSKAFHLLRIEADGARLDASLDEGRVRWQGRLGASPARASLSTRRAAAAFKGFALTRGWQNLFEEDAPDASAHGWQTESGKWSVETGLLRCGVQSGATGLLHKDAPSRSYELVVNVRLEGGGGAAETRATGDAKEAGATGATGATSDMNEADTTKGTGAAGAVYGFYPAYGVSGARGLLLAVKGAGAGRWRLEAVREGGGVERVFELPEAFDPSVFQQFRFVKQGSQLIVGWEGAELGAFELSAEKTEQHPRVGLWAGSAPVCFDMVRVTSLES